MAARRGARNMTAPSASDTPGSVAVSAFSVASHLSQWARQSNDAKKGQHVYYFESIDSTNTYLKNSVQSRAICLAAEQTAGRGRGSNRWFAQAGSSLLGSWSYRLSGAPSPQLTMRVGLAVIQAIELSLAQSGAQLPSGTTLCLKAPNDIHSVSELGEVYKLAGLLVEVVSHTKKEVSLVIGLGLNLTDSPAHTEPFAATSLAELNVSITQKLIFHLLDGITAGFGELERNPQHQTGLLTEPERLALLSRLRPHPLFQSLIEVTPTGDLIYTDKTVAWTAL